MSIRTAALCAGFLAATLAVAAGAGAQQIKYSCSESKTRTSNDMIMTHTDDHDRSRPLVEHFRQKSGYCLHTVALGRVEFNERLTDVASVPPGARLMLHEFRGSRERRLELTGTEQGVARRYTEDGIAAEYDAAAQAWLQSTILMLVRTSGFDAAGRVERIRARGGVDAVLREITEIESDGVQRRYYAALLEGSPRLGRGDVERVLGHAVRTVESDGDLRSVFTTALKKDYAIPTDALSAAMSAIDSDGDRRSLLVQLLPQADEATMLTALRALPRIDSDGDKASVLVQAARPALGAQDARIRDAYFAAARTIDSDGDLRRVLTSALRASTTPPVVAHVVATSAVIDADGDKAAVLVAVARTGVVQQSDTMREAYLRVARTIDSPGDYRRAVDPMVPY